MKYSAKGGSPLFGQLLPAHVLVPPPCRARVLVQRAERGGAFAAARLERAGGELLLRGAQACGSRVLARMALEGATLTEPARHRPPLPTAQPR